MKAARSLTGIRRPYRYEIGPRVRPQFAIEPPTTRDEAHGLCYPDGDDLSGYCAGLDEVRPGAVLHLYFEANRGSVEWPEWELDEIVVVWVGTDAHEPRVIDTRFVKYPEDRHPGEARCDRCGQYWIDVLVAHEPMLSEALCPDCWPSA